MKTYFIYDCASQIVGNPKGYPTYRGASQQAFSTKSKAYAEIRSAYENARLANPAHCHVCKIKLAGA
jgi:hypothetical protein